MGPYIGPYLGPYLAALFCTVGCPILHFGLPYGAVCCSLVNPLLRCQSAASLRTLSATLMRKHTVSLDSCTHAELPTLELQRIDNEATDSE